MLLACMQVLLLAGPGVVIGGGLTAVFVHYVFPYNWTWMESFLFGSILAATDPVAVVALLKEVSSLQLCFRLQVQQSTQQIDS